MWCLTTDTCRVSSKTPHYTHTHISYLTTHTTSHSHSHLISHYTHHLTLTLTSHISLHTPHHTHIRWDHRHTRCLTTHTTSHSHSVSLRCLTTDCSVCVSVYVCVCMPTVRHHSVSSVSLHTPHPTVRHRDSLYSQRQVSVQGPLYSQRGLCTGTPILTEYTGRESLCLTDTASHSRVCPWSQHMWEWCTDTTPRCLTTHTTSHPHSHPTSHHVFLTNL